MRVDDVFTQDILRRQDLVLREAVKRGISLAEMSIRTARPGSPGIPKATLESYLARRMSPQAAMGLPNAVRIMAVLVEAGLCALAGLLIEPSGCDVVERDPEARNLHIIAAQTARFNAMICEAGADGRFDHRERAEIRAEAPELISSLQHLVSDGGT